MKIWELAIGVGLLIGSVIYGSWLNVAADEPRPWDYYMPFIAIIWLVWRGKLFDRFR